MEDLTLYSGTLTGGYLVRYALYPIEDDTGLPEDPKKRTFWFDPSGMIRAIWANGEHGNIIMFGDLDEAIAWLLEGEDD